MNTIKVKVEWVAPEGLQRGKPTDDFILVAGSTITDLVNLMIDTHGENARMRLLEEDSETPHVYFVLNGKIVPLDYVLHVDTELMILPPVYGG